MSKIKKALEKAKEARESDDTSSHGSETTSPATDSKVKKAVEKAREAQEREPSAQEPKPLHRQQNYQQRIMMGKYRSTYTKTKVINIDPADSQRKTR